jgi:hypothetical protein
MPWLIKGLLVLLKTRKGRELLFTAGLAAVELAQREQARKLYARARTRVTDPAVRQRLTESARRAAQTIRR